MRPTCTKQSPAASRIAGDQKSSTIERMSIPAAAAAAASSGVSTNSIVSCRLPLSSRRPATVSLLCFVNAIGDPPLSRRPPIARGRPTQGRALHLLRLSGATAMCWRAASTSARQSHTSRLLDDSGSCAAARERRDSLLPKPSLAQTFVTDRNVQGVLSQPFDGEVRIEAKGFGHVPLRFVHLALECVGGSEAQVGPLRAVAGVERLVIGVDRGFEMTSGKFYVAQLPIPIHPPRIIRAQPNRVLYVGSCLVKAAEGYLRQRSSMVELLIVRIDCEAGVRDPDRLVKTCDIAK